MRLKFVKVTKKNIDFATDFQMSIFPDECAYEHFLSSINSGKDYWNYYLVYNSGALVGITGLYSYDDMSDTNTIWLGWFGVAEQYRKHGIGKAILLKTIALAKKLSIKYPDIKFFRLYTSTRDNPIAVKLYREIFTIEEKYNRKDDFDYDGTCLIFSMSLNDNDKVYKWNNRFMNLNMIVEDEERGGREYKKIR